MTTDGLSRPAFKLAFLWIANVLLAITGVLYYIGFQPVAHVHDLSGSQKRTSWVWLDYVTSHEDKGSYEGQVRKPVSGVFWLDNTTSAMISVAIAGKQVYHGTDSSRIVLDPNLATVIPFTIDYQLASKFPPDGHIALMQEGIFGIRYLVPAWRFTEDAAPDVFGDATRLLCFLMGIATISFFVGSLRISRRGWLGLAIIMILALGVRLISLNEKFVNDPSLWTMDHIWDNYVSMGRSWIAGYQQVGGTIYQQGTFIYLGFLQMAIGPQLSTLYIFNTTIGSLCAGFAVLAGWMLFDEATGWIAGLITALFAPLIHYQQTLQDVAPVILILAALLVTLAGLYRQPSAIFAIMYAFLIGLGTTLRNTIYLLIFVPFILIVLQNRPLKVNWKRLLGFTAILIVLPALCIAPITIANFRAGYHVLTANLADYQLFRSNNLNSSGLNTYLTQSEQLAVARGDSWTQALARDTARNSSRIIQLTIRRVALFWDPHEHSDSGMIDYQSTGLDVSPTLRLLSLNDTINFRILMYLALAGLGLGFIYAPIRRETLFLALTFGLFIAPLSIFYVIGRVRAPLAVIASLLASVGLATFWRLLMLSRADMNARKKYGLAVTGILVLALLLTEGFNFLIVNLPRPALVRSDQISESMVPITGTYENELQLAGYAFYDTNNKPGGYLTFELFWKTLRKPLHDYVVTFRLINNKTKALDDIQNFMLGTLTTPTWTDTQWNPGEIYDERYLLKLPTGSGENIASYDIYVGLYDEAKARSLIVSAPNAPVLDNHLRLTAVGIGTVKTATSAPDLLIWGQALALRKFTCESDSRGVTLNFGWQVLERPAKAMTMFVHVVKDNLLLSQRDIAPDENTPTDAWLRGSLMSTRLQFQGVSGPVILRVGFYDFTNQRWAITNRGPWTITDDYIVLNCPMKMPEVTF